MVAPLPWEDGRRGDHRLSDLPRICVNRFSHLTGPARPTPPASLIVGARPGRLVGDSVRLHSIYSNVHAEREMERARPPNSLRELSDGGGTHTAVIRLRPEYSGRLEQARRIELP